MFSSSDFLIFEYRSLSYYTQGMLYSVSSITYKEGSFRFPDLYSIPQ